MRPTDVIITHYVNEIIALRKNSASWKMKRAKERNGGVKIQIASKNKSDISGFFFVHFGNSGPQKNSGFKKPQVPFWTKNSAFRKFLAHIIPV